MEGQVIHLQKQLHHDHRLCRCYVLISLTLCFGYSISWLESIDQEKRARVSDGCGPGRGGGGGEGSTAPVTPATRPGQPVEMQAGKLTLICNDNS